MMKAAAGLKRGSRKKQPPAQGQPAIAPVVQQERPPTSRQEQPQRPQQQQPPRPQQHSQPPPPPQPQQVPHPAIPQPPQQRRVPSQRREPAPEQIELTKRNYRLAKELSELRVRHREECKNVTRLTMENMNLASRCREAISHVAMLKKELAMHQKRAQEALKFQREQTQRMASNLSAEVSRLSHSYSDDSPDNTPDRKKAEMERVLSAIEPPPPPPPRNSTPPPMQAVVVEQRQIPKENGESRTVSPSGEFHTDVVSSDEDETVEESNRHGRSVLDVVESLSDLSSPKEMSSTTSSDHPLPPRVFSTPNRHRKEDRWTPNIDRDPGSGGKDMDGMSLFPHSASPKVVGRNHHHNHRNNYNEEFPADIMPNGGYGNHSYSDEDDDDDDGDAYIPHPSLLDRHSGMITINSIDAFEASFDTTFPSTFAHRENGTPTKSSSSRVSPQSSTTEIYNPFAPSPARSERSVPTTPTSSRRDSDDGPEVVRKVHASDPIPFSPPRAEDPQYETPPKDRKGSPANPDGEPSRPHKTVSAEARRRYEKALQPKSGAANNTSSQSSVSTTNAVAPAKGGDNHGTFSPARLLQRIHNRRKHKEENAKEDAPQVTPPATIETEYFDQYSPSESSLRENVAPSAATSQQQVLPAPYREPIEPQGLTPNEQSARSNSSSFRSSGSSERSEDVPAGRPGGMVARLNSLKIPSRRAVKQPVSYAEPALNTKIRQGHDFFPKSDGDEPPKIVTPEPQPASAV